MELKNQFAVARMFKRFPSEISHISGHEFLKFEEIMYEEKAEQEARQREIDRQAWLKQGA